MDVVELLRQQQLTCFDNPYRTSFFSSTYADTGSVVGFGTGMFMTAYIQHQVLGFASPGPALQKRKNPSECYKFPSNLNHH